MKICPGLEDGLANTPRLRSLLKAVLEDLAGLAASNTALRVHAVCDRDSDHFLLIAEGWQGYRRIYRILAHIAIIGSGVHIFEDTTIDGIVGYLLAAGVPMDRITCAWEQAPVAERTAHR